MNQRLYKLVNPGNAFLTAIFWTTQCCWEQFCMTQCFPLWPVGGTRKVCRTQITTEAWPGEFVTGVPSPERMRLQPSRNGDYRPQASPLHLWSLWPLVQLCTPSPQWREDGRWANSGILSSKCRRLAPGPEPYQGTLHLSATTSQQTVGRGSLFLHGRRYGPLESPIPLISVGQSWLPESAKSLKTGC
jgi:hypothetical protein